MTRHNPPARYVLPETVNPARKCIQVQVPDDPYHIAAFRGALNTLASAYNWQDDPYHKAKDVALVWRDCIDNSIEWGCSLTPTFRSDGCALQVSYNEGETWTTIFDATECATNITNTIIGILILDGTIATPQQPKPGGGLSPAECKVEYVTLRAKERWHCPVPVKGGYTVQVEDAKGGWWDGDFAAFWKCPSGANYALGECGFGETTVGTDPAPSVYHMRAVVNVGAYWDDIYNTTYTVPLDITDLSELYIQANDSGLDDNQGDITMKVTICRPAGWCYLFDFTVDDGGWSPYGAGQGVYVSGQYWDSQDVVIGVDRTICQIHKTFASTHITSVSITYNRLGSGAQSSGVAGRAIFAGSEVAQTGMDATPDGTSIPFEWSGDVDATEIILDIQASHGSFGGYGRITRCVVRGDGDCPFGEPNC